MMIAETHFLREEKASNTNTSNEIRETCKIWDELYHEHYDKEGRTEDRGLPGEDFYKSEWVEYFNTFACYK